MLIYYGELKRPHGQAVKTAPSQGAITSSILVGVTNQKRVVDDDSSFFILFWTTFSGNI